MPVFDTGSNLNNVSGEKTSGRFPFLLIISDSCRCYQNLSSAMTMPVIATSRFKSHIKHGYIKFFLVA